MSRSLTLSRSRSVEVGRGASFAAKARDIGLRLARPLQFFSAGSQSGASVAEPPIHGALLQIGPDGYARLKEIDGWPRLILIAVDSPFDCSEMIDLVLGALPPQKSAQVHLVWAAERPGWAGRSFNRSLVLENLQYSRQRAVACLEQAASELEANGYTATWEAEETDSPAERIADAAREAAADLVVVSDSLSSGLLGRRTLTQLLDQVARPVMVIGPGHHVGFVAGSEVYLGIGHPSHERSEQRGIPPPANATAPDAPTRSNRIS